jgi:hypothetical protein
VRARFELIDAEKADFPIVKMCEWAGVSTSGYYEWRDRPASATAIRRDHLTKLITAIFALSDGTYGYRRVHAQLVRQGEQVSDELVRALMGGEGWLYLATVIDCCTKECIGYAMADHLRSELVIDALHMAARNYSLAPGAIFHSDSEYVWAGGPGLPDPHSDGHARMLVPGCSRAS